MAVTFKKKPDKDERLAIRISSKDKFAVELYAQKTGRTISAIAKEALDHMLKDPERGLYVKTPGGEMAFLPDLCWDRLQADRLTKLALHAPELLSDYESVLWKVMMEDRSCWKDDGQPDFEKIRNNWIKLNSRAASLIESHG